MKKSLCCPFRFLLFPVLLLAASELAAESPNLLWITAEDMSATLGCYGDDYATTPNLDALATESVRYTKAFATAPVCSPSRSCLINGVYAPTQGTHQMRSAFPIDDEMTGFPSFIRKRGYYTSNNVKTDYNSANFKEIEAASWDETSATAHWQGKQNDQPFFSVFNLMTSHQSRSMVWPYEKFEEEVQSKLSKDEIHDPAEAPLPAYYVDTPVVRKTVARFYDCVTAMDKEVGALLKELEDDGLAEDTIVFFYSDHGSGMPRHKRALLDSGMHVPLMIRFPEKYKHLAPGKPGSTSDRLVSFVDFGPTALSLLGIDVPDYMQGVPFLGEAAGPARELVFGHRDRVDEVSDLARSVRDGKYLLIRNFMPHLGYNQFTAWPDLGEIRGEFYANTDKETMTPAQWHFAGPTRPVIEFYDCEADPMNLNNLADNERVRDDAVRLVGALQKHLLSTKDRGYMPEAEMFAGADEELDAAAVEAGWRAADAVGFATKDELMTQLGSDDTIDRYWAVVGLCAFKGDLGADVEEALKEALLDKVATVRIEAANVLARRFDNFRGRNVLERELRDKDLRVVMHAARTLELLGSSVSQSRKAMEKLKQRCEKIRPPGTSPVVVQPDKDMAMFIGFSANGFLQRVPEE